MIGCQVALAQLGLRTGKSAIQLHTGGQYKGDGAVSRRRRLVGACCYPEHISRSSSGYTSLQVTIGVGPARAVIAAGSVDIYVDGIGKGRCARDNSEQQE